MKEDIITSEGILIVVYIVLYLWNTIYTIQYYKRMYPKKNIVKINPLYESDRKEEGRNP
jgi:hypothetical protein